MQVIVTVDDTEATSIHAAFVEAVGAATVLREVGEIEGWPRDAGTKRVISHRNLPAAMLAVVPAENLYAEATWRTDSGWVDVE